MEKIVVSKVQEAIVEAACQHFGVTEDILISGTTFNVAYMRWCVFFLVKRNTMLSERFIGYRLKRKICAVRNGIETIEARKIYRQTVEDLKEIARIAGISDY